MLGLSLSFIACSDWEEEENKNPVDTEVSPEDPHSDAVDEDSKKEPASDKADEKPPRELIVDLIFEKERVNQKTFVGHVREGDEVVIQLTGIKKTRKFSDIYYKTVNSSWKREECESSGCIGCDFGDERRTLEGCFDIFEHGKCTMSYRDYVGEVRSSIEFAGEPENIPLHFIIGDKLYRIDQINFHKGDFIRGVFKIREGMIQDTDELYLRPVNNSNGDIKTGFLEYGHCDGQFKRGFHASGSISSGSVPNDVRREFQVDIAIIRSGGE